MQERDLLLDEKGCTGLWILTNTQAAVAFQDNATQPGP
jgi:hypothetical protein